MTPTAPASISFSVDPVAAVVGVVAVLVSLIIWWRSTSYPKLLARSSSRPLFSVDAAAADRITVLLDGERVDDVQLVEVDIANIGRAPIRAGDFEEPLRLALPPGGDILSVEPIRVTPSGPTPALRLTEAAVEIEPLLLNPGDGMTLLLVARGAGPTATLDPPRIAGLTERRVVREGSAEPFLSGLRSRDVALWAGAMIVILAGTIIPYLWALGAMWLATIFLLNRRSA